MPETSEAAFANFSADYVVTVSEVLELKLTVTNLSPSAEFKYEECLHSYFTIGDIGAVSLKGLAGTKYLDKVAGGAEKLERTTPSWFPPKWTAFIWTRKQPSKSTTPSCAVKFWWRKRFGGDGGLESVDRQGEGHGRLW